MSLISVYCIYVVVLVLFSILLMALKKLGNFNHSIRKIYDLLQLSLSEFEPPGKIFFTS